MTRGETAPEQLFTATYTVTGNRVSVNDGGDVFTATLNENNQLVTNIDGNGECRYVKQ